MIDFTKRPSSMSLNELAAVVVELSFQIHRKHGPGLLESVYQALLTHKLRKLGFFVEEEKPVRFDEDGVIIDIGFRADMVIECRLLVELKSVEKMVPVFPKIVLTHLRGLKLHLGLLINFGEVYLKNGIKRIVDGNFDLDASPIVVV